VTQKPKISDSSRGNTTGMFIPVIKRFLTGIQIPMTAARNLVLGQSQSDDEEQRQHSGSHITCVVDIGISRASPEPAPRIASSPTVDHHDDIAASQAYPLPTISTVPSHRMHSPLPAVSLSPPQNDDQHMSSPPLQTPVDNMETFLYYRFGYTLSEDPYQGLSPNYAIGKASKTIHNYETAVRALSAQGLLRRSAEPDTILDFAMVLHALNEVKSAVPSKYWDLSSASNNALVNLPEEHLHFRVEPLGKDLFILHPQGLSNDDIPQWDIAVSPSVVLEIIRRGLRPNPQDVIVALVDEGVAFCTVVYKRGLQSLPPPLPPPMDLLGGRTIEHRFIWGDFLAYEKIRDSVLQTEANARHALSYGGLTARLASQALRISDIVAGPSDSVFDGEQDVLRNKEDETFVDNTLSYEFFNLIHGTYKVGSNAV